MRNTFILCLILLTAAFVVAQQGAAPSTAPDANGQMQNPGMQNPSQSRPGMPAGQAGTPDQAAPAGGSDMIEGCLGGSNPNFTVTDKSGTSYQILIPQGADASPLAKHIGESVKVEGTLDSAAKSASAPDSGSAPGATPGNGARSIHAMRIGRGTTTCSAGSSTPAPKPPSK